MFGFGIAELLIVIIVAVMAFGAPALIGFWLGYTAGRKSSGGGSSEPSAPSTEPAADSAQEDSDE